MWDECQESDFILPNYIMAYLAISLEWKCEKWFNGNSNWQVNGLAFPSHVFTTWCTRHF